MTPIRWTEPAREDLRHIRAYIGRDSRQYAARMIERIRRRVEGVRRFPLAASRVPEWDREDFREIFVGPYRVIFRYDGNVIEVMAVVHGARQLPEHETD